MSLPWSSFRSKVVVNSGLILLLLASATLYTGYASLELAQSVEKLFANTLALDLLEKTLGATEASLGSYLRSKNTGALAEHSLQTARLRDQSTALGRDLRGEETVLLQRSLGRVFETYLDAAEGAVRARQNRDLSGYAARFEDASRHAGYARRLLGDLRTRYLSQSLAAFSTYRSLIPGVLLSNAMLVLSAALLAFLLVLRSAQKLSEPLSRLSEAALVVARGDYQSTLPLVESNDEIGTTARAFQLMRQSVRDSFVNLNRLKDAEMLALQTQINPHFLFNTLSAGMQLAEVENAGRTSAFLETLAQFIRYALTPPGRLVTVADELACVEQYLWLLKLRFGERYRFEVSVDPSVLPVELPALLLQPLVENAVSHGLGDREEGGVVTVAGFTDGELAVLEVRDNGAGMSPDEISAVLRHTDEAPGDHGIGLSNVIRRVVLSTGSRGRVEVISPPGEGTTIRLLLPRARVE